MAPLNFNPFDLPEMPYLTPSTPPTTRRLTVRFSADDAEHVVEGIDDTSFRVAGRALPSGVWLTAVLQHSPAFDVRIPVVAGARDMSDRQTFAAVTEAGREMLRVLAVQATIAPVDTLALPPARVLRPSAPFRPYIVRALS